MAYHDLKSFIDALRRAGELVEIREPASIDQEIACASDRVSKLPLGGPALLFHNPIDADGNPCDAPVLINALGSEKRIAMVCEVEDFEGLRTRLSDMLTELQAPRRSLIDKLKVLPTLKNLAGFMPRHVGKGPCQQVVQTGDQIDLSEIPVLTTWPDDGGPFITFPLVFTESPHDGKRNCGMYRIQIFDKTTTGFHVHTHHTAAEHMREAKRNGETRLPAAIAIGGAPAVTFSAVIPLPPGMDEMILAGFLQGAPVEMVKCVSVPLSVPAQSDYVIEGWIEIDERRTEGPFGDHTGFYSLADEYPVFHVSAITRRRDPTYLTTVVGPPSQEDCWMGRAIERLFLPLMQQTIPEVLDYRLPFSGVFHNLLVVKIRKSYAGQGRKVAHAIWGLGQAMFTKCIVVVDESAPDTTDEAAMARFVLDRLDARHSFEIIEGPTETLDHATPVLHLGSKFSIDATTPFAGEGENTTVGHGISGLSPNEFAPTRPTTIAPELSDLPVTGTEVYQGGPWVLELDKTEPWQARKIANEVFARAGDSALPLIIILPTGLIDAGDPEQVVWATLANMDPLRDVIFDETATTRDHRNVLDRHPHHIAVDATIKTSAEGFTRDWPTVQRHSDATLRRVEQLVPNLL